MVKGKYEQTAAADIKTVKGLKNKLCSRGYSKNQFFPENCAACRACCFGVRLVQLMEQNGAVYESNAQERSFTSELLKSQQAMSLKYRMRRHFRGKEA